jgi:LruC domain-containing protein
MKNIRLFILLIIAATIISCNDKTTDTPVPDTVISMEQLDVSLDFDWSASMSGELVITLLNPLNVSTEREYIQIVNDNGNILDHRVVSDNSATFDLNLPKDGDYYIYYPVTTDKVMISGPGTMEIELGPTVEYIYNSTKSTQVVSCTSCENPMENGGGELPAFGSGWRLYSEDDVPGWETTASDNKIEFWVSGFQGVPAQEGRQFFELNANQVAALYQELCLEPGSIIYWSVWHRGRSGVDVAEVKIGATVETAESQEIMSDGKTAWGHYFGTYNVPADQTTTVFVFESISATGGSLSVGNFLDNFEISCDADGDGIIDRYDEFPEDPDAAFLSFFPEDGKQVVAFEDLWPSLGDFDFNDLVLSNQVTIRKDADGNLVNADFKVSIDAIGASIDNGIAMMLYTEDLTVFGDNIIENVTGDAGIDPGNENGLILTSDIFETIGDRYQNNGSGPTGVPDTLEFTITFNDNAANFIPELYLFRTDVRGHEVHRSGFPLTSTMDSDLFNTEDDAGDFKSATGLPWGMEIITSETYQNPIEKVDILLAYPKFEAWATSDGANEQTWYLFPIESNVVDLDFGD